MRNKIAVLISGALLLCAPLAISGCGSQPGPAASPSTNQAPSTTAAPTSSAAIAQVSLTVLLQAFPNATGGGITSLTCDGGTAKPGSDVPDPASACKQLAALKASFFETTPPKGPCTEQYGGPQVAQVRGSFQGTPVVKKFTQSNGCEIDAWNQISGLLGPAGAK